MGSRTKALQHWLNLMGAQPSLVEDGLPGPATRRAIIETFRNREAPAVTSFEIADIADRLGCSMRQLKAVARVESSGGGWDNAGLLKCLWERHYLWRRIRVAVPFLSNPTPGGYTTDADRNGINDSWEKVADATLRFGAGFAFECASWGKFQIMGAHWKALGYPTVLDFVWGMSRSETAHYEAFARYIEVNGLRDALRSVSVTPRDNRPMAYGYNGPAYAQGGYHIKMADEMRRLG